MLQKEIFAMLDAADIGILIAKGNGSVVWVNERYTQITHLQKTQLIGKSLEQINKIDNYPVMGNELIYTTIMREKKNVTRTVDFKTKRDIICHGTPIFNDKGEIQWLVYYLIDYDGLRELREQLSHAFEENEAIRLRLQEASESDLRDYGIVARDKEVINAFSTALRVSRVDATLLILGETGTGKDKLAKYVHAVGPRCNAHFVHVNCSAIPEALFESELFGYEPGSFSGASKKGKMGLIELADKGTLFLDEVAELPLSMQAKILTVLQDKRITRVGGIHPIDVDIRVIAATNKDLKELTEKELFRKDLYYRLNTLEIKLPPLRERKEDILAFIYHFMKVYNQKYEMNKTISLAMVEKFMEYSWPGNVREICHMIQRLIIMCPHEIIDLDCLPGEMLEEQKSKAEKITAPQELELQQESTQELGVKDNISVLGLAEDDKKPFLIDVEKGDSLKQIVAQVESEVIREVIGKTENLQEAARQLGIEISTLTKKKQRYNIYKK